jgi:molybdenum cofactor cytidylyltransferase
LTRTAGVVLAAGSSRRMGRPKQLLDVGGRPLLEMVVGQTNDSQLDEVFVVLGARADEIRARVDFGRARVVANHDHESGMASSLRAGLSALDADVEAAMVILGDQPDGAGRIDRLLELERESGLPAAALSFGGLLHPPVLLRRELWGDLMRLEGDVGCRAIIRARPDLVAKLDVDGPKHPVDVDTPEDYMRFVAR